MFDYSVCWFGAIMHKSEGGDADDGYYVIVKKPTAAGYAFLKR